MKNLELTQGEIDFINYLLKKESEENKQTKETFNVGTSIQDRLRSSSIDRNILTVSTKIHLISK